MKMHKLEVYVIDFEDYGIEEYENILENNRYGNFKVKAAETTDIGEWHDGHELNMRTSGVDTYRKYFNK